VSLPCIDPSRGTAASSARVYGWRGDAKICTAWPVLDDLAAIHDEHAVGDLGHDAHVVRDEHDGHVHLVLQLPDELEDLRLDGDVERRRRLVGDQQPRLARQRHRDHHALAHPARKLVRVAVEHLRRLRDADLLEHAQRLPPGRREILALVQPDRFGDLLADREHRIERCHRLLEDHRDLCAANGAHRCRIGMR
jgi:hypothetical protein